MSQANNLVGKRVTIADRVAMARHAMVGVTEARKGTGSGSPANQVQIAQLKERLEAAFCVGSISTNLGQDISR